MLNIDKMAMHLIFYPEQMFMHGSSATSAIYILVWYMSLQ